MTALAFIVLCLHFFTDVLKGAGPAMALIFCGVSLLIQFGSLVYRVITSREDDLCRFRNPPEPWKYTTTNEQKDRQEVYDDILEKIRIAILTEQMEERRKRKEPTP